MRMAPVPAASTTMAATAGPGSSVVANATNTAKDTHAKSPETHTAARHNPLSTPSHSSDDGCGHREADHQPSQYQPRSAMAANASPGLTPPSSPDLMTPRTTIAVNSTC